MFDPQDAPEHAISDEEQEELRRVGAETQEFHRQINPSPVVGVATEHSIEDPFTGQISVEVRLL